MAITAVCDSIAPWALANLVASTAEFQRATGTASEAAALNYIHFIEAEDRRAGDGAKPQPRPRAIIEWAERKRDKQGTGLFVDTGQLALTLEVLEANLDLTGAATPPTFQELSIGFMNFYGTLLNQCEVNIDTDPNRYLNCQEITLFEGPMQVREREEEFWAVVFMVSWFG